MSDLISRKMVIEALYNHYEVNNKAQNATMDECIMLVKNIPSAEPKKGRWRHYEGVLTCLECGAEFYDDIMEYTGDEVPHFCPDCGANMEG